MRIRVKFLYALLVGLLLVNFALIAGYLYLEKGKEAGNISQEQDRQQVAPQKPEVVIENKLRGIKVKLDTEKTFRLLQDTKFLQGYMAVNLNTLQEYNPKVIVIAFYEKDNLQGLPLSQRFKVGGRVAYGYGIVQSDGLYRLDFYFNPEYFASLKREDLDYVLNSALVKAIVRLAAIHNKRKRLSPEEEREVIKMAVGYLDKFKLVYAEKG